MLDIASYKTQLLALRTDLTGRIKAIDKDLHHEEIAIEKDFAEQATQLENDEVLNSLEHKAKAAVMEIDRALLRIENHTYGTCIACNNTIDEQRLSISPQASLCITCAKKAE